MHGLSLKSTEEIRSHKRANGMHSTFLIGGMALLLSAIGFVMYGWIGMGIALVLAVFGIIFGRMASPAMVLKMYKAQQVTPDQAPELVDMFHALCHRGGLETLPKLYYVPSRMPNAFAVGSEETAAVAITDGIYRMMNPREMAGVLAHEISHLRHYDTKTMATADTISRFVSFFSRIGLLTLAFSFSSMAFGGSPGRLVITGLLLFFAPAVSILLQLALSRRREFSADLGAVELTGDPYGLASALEKLERIQPHGFWKKMLRPGRRRYQPAMLRTHPSSKERIERLLSLAKKQVGNVPTPARPVIPKRIVIGMQPRVRKKPRYHIMSGVWK